MWAVNGSCPKTGNSLVDVLKGNQTAHYEGGHVFRPSNLALLIHGL